MTPQPLGAQRAMGVVLKVVGTLLALYLVHEAWLEREVAQYLTPRLKQELADKHQKVLNHASLVAQLQEMRALLASLEQHLPHKLASPAIEKALRDQAARVGVKIASMRLDLPETVEEGFYADRPINLVVEGSTADFVKFMDGVLRDSPLRRITAMKIEPADNTRMVRTTMTAYYYHYIDESN